MTSQQIQYILTLVEERNFSRAAKRLYVTQPSLSQFIKNIENQIGTPLFDRSVTPIRLTPAGEAYVDTAKKIQLAEMDLETQLADLSNLEKGQLSLGTSTFRAACMLPRSLMTFKKKYPGIRLDVVSEHVDMLKSMLTSGDIDLCIETDNFDPISFQTEDLCDETYYLAVSRNHPINKGMRDLRLDARDIMEDSDRIRQIKGVDLSTLADYGFTLLKPGRSIYNVTMEIFRSFEMHPDIALYAHHIETAFHWSLHGVALTLVPDTLVRFGNYREHPYYYRIASPYAKRKIVIVSKRNRYLSHAAQEYVSILKQLVRLGTWRHNQ